MKLGLPIGNDNFRKLRENDMYYVDKTLFLKDLLKGQATVTLFTRPRRFGKSLMMSMVREFLSLDGRPEFFDGLAIEQETEFCAKWQHQFPVIFLSFKDVEGDDETDLFHALTRCIGDEVMRFSFLANSPKLSETDKAFYRQLTTPGTESKYATTKDAAKSSLRTLSELLAKHYGKDVVILIDEYDVPLTSAWKAGCYDQVVGLLRSLFSAALKSNPYLKFAVLTGCLRISKESIFTGLNNLKVHSLATESFPPYFGFTEDEVKTMLAYYGLSDHYDQVKEWYDGYSYRGTSIYNPWDTINYVQAVLDNETTEPESYWMNSSGNAILLTLLQKSDSNTKAEIETLIAGGSIKKPINDQLTYRDVESKIDNIYSMMFASGYLTCLGKEDGLYKLAIPNREIKEVFIKQIRDWVVPSLQEDVSRVSALFSALVDGRAKDVQFLFTTFLQRTISLRDTMDTRKEHFYHGILAGLLGGQKPKSWDLASNAESGDGYSDILLTNPDTRKAVIIEMKYARSSDIMDDACTQAIQQIADKQYARSLLLQGYQTILTYGIACHGKQCKVMKG